MKKRWFTVLTAYLLAAAMLLTACSSGQHASTDGSGSTSSPQTSEAELSSAVSVPETSSESAPALPESTAAEGSSAAERSTAAEGSSVPETDPWADAVDFSALKTTPAALRYTDWELNQLDLGTIPVMTVVVTFKDGYQIDKEAFEAQMEGMYDLDNCIRSVASYYHYTSYGRVSFDFQYIYYDSGLTCSEAWHYVNDKDAYGSITGNRYIKEIFEDIRSRPADFGIADFTSLDGNKDGYVDLPMFLFAEDPFNIVEGEEWVIYGAARGSFINDDPPADVNDPNINYFIKMPYKSSLTPPDTEEDRSTSGSRTAIHEIGHMFGLMDYYDFLMYNDELIDVLGMFDMQSRDLGDWNPFSKFSVGFLDPYVIKDLEDSITIRLGCPIEKSQAIRSPNAAGWNGTPADE